VIRALSAYVVIAGALMLAVSAEAGDEASPAWIDQSRELSRRLGEGLRAELTRAIEKDGPIEAISVCRDRAPAIAAKLSEESGARVGRTALAVRNPANAPDDFDRAVLDGFANALQAGGSTGPLEAAFWVNRAGVTERRYLRAIVTESLCVTCHGTSIAPELAAAIAREYPQDKATGFAPGQLRGAFKIVWPAADSSRPGL